MRNQNRLITTVAAGLLMGITACVSTGSTKAPQLHGTTADPIAQDAATETRPASESHVSGNRHGTVGHYIADVYQTSQAGDNLILIATLIDGSKPAGVTSTAGRTVLNVQPHIEYQEYFGFGASFTESSAWNLATIPAAARREVLTKLFSPSEGAGFSLTRTHINSSDYSNNHYTYIDEGDENLSSFSVNEDLKGFDGKENEQVAGVVLEDASYDLIPMILEAQSIPGAAFKVIASPWSPPSWMKTGETGKMTNGSLQEKYHAVWAEYLSKYLAAYADEGVKIWALTPQNEPLHAEHARWDSNGWSAPAARDFLRDHLGPRLERDGHLNLANLEEGVRILIYDHNKSVMNDYVAPTYSDPDATKYAWGTAFHWYAASELEDNNWFGAELTKLHESWPDKVMIHTESSVDINASDPVGQYWVVNTDYAGRFVPFTTYAYDIITNLNNWTQGYVDWCMILSNEGKPNPYDNFNSAPVLINPQTDEVIYTPLYYLLSHFSKFIRPGARRIAIENDELVPGLIYTAAKNPDNTIAIVVFNNNDVAHDFNITISTSVYHTQIAPHAIQTIHLR